MALTINLNVHLKEEDMHELGSLIQAIHRDLLNGQGETMAKLQDVIDATFQTGEAARAAIDRVAEDFATVSGNIVALQQQVADLKAALEAAGTASAELAALEAGLNDVVASQNAITANLQGVDPIPTVLPEPTP